MAATTLAVIAVIAVIDGLWVQSEQTQARRMTRQEARGFDPMERTSLARCGYPGRVTARSMLISLALLLVALGMPALAQERAADASGSGMPSLPGLEACRQPTEGRLRERPRQRIVWGGHRNRIIHFTFDDGPREDSTGPLLDALDAAGVRATFFMVGRRLDPSRHGAEGRLALVRRMVERGHTLAGHTYDHVDIRPLSLAELDAELTRMERMLDPFLGDGVRLFRPPFGSHGDRVDRALERRGYTEVLWNLPPRSTERPETPERVLAFFQEQLELRIHDADGPGSLVVLHDTDPQVGQAMPAILADIDRRNCEALAAGEELWDIVPTLGPFCDLRPRPEEPRFRARIASFAPELLEARQRALRARYRSTCGLSAPTP